MSGSIPEDAGAKAEKVFKVLGTVAGLMAAAVAVWVAATSAKNPVAGVFLFLIMLVFFGLIFLTVAYAISEQFKPKALRDKEQADSERYRREHKTDYVPLKKWRGLSHMTKAATVEAFCRRCKWSWRLDGKKANTVADAQGLGNRMIRGGTKTEQFGATFTAGASGRRIAAGNEHERQMADLGWALSLAACPKCHQVDEVALKKP